MLTAYDHPTAELLDQSGVDWILVGDSLGMVVLGYSSTLPVTMDEMIHHAKAARRGVKNACLIGDIPLKGIEKGPRQALDSAKRFIEEAGCDAVKLEWGPQAAVIAALFKKHRIPFMGHVGLTPQRVKPGEGFRVKGASGDEAHTIYESAKVFEKNGAFAVLLECVPEKVSKLITENLKVPTIGIGAGKYCDGQVLVFHDLAGIFTRFTPRFVKRYANTHAIMRKAVARYAQEVKSGRFPAKKHTFSIDEKELDGVFY